MDINSIQKTLKDINNLYNQQDDNGVYDIPNELLCKIATLELCGWLEDTFDALIINCQDRLYKQLPKLDKSSIPNKDFLANFSSYNSDVSKHLSSVHGLSYKGHFRKLLLCLLGNPIILTIEFKIGLDEMEIFSTKLDNLHAYRSRLAHKSCPGISQQQTLDSPGVMLKLLEEIEPTLQKFEKALNSLEIVVGCWSMK